MNKIESQLIRILNSSIHGQKAEFKNNEDIEWEVLLEEAKEHSIIPLIYTAINKTGFVETMDKNMLEKLKFDVIRSGINQSNHIKQISKVLENLNDANIDVIVLKGLVVRDLYPYPDCRTMCDADIIGHKEDLKEIANILTTMGYSQTKQEDEHGAHIVFIKGMSCIEVHWTLFNEDFFKGNRFIERELWKDAMKVKVGGVDTFSLSWEDLAMHLCVHMASHFSHKGFGVRQLCDLVLLVEQKGQEVDWISFNNKIKQCKLERFTASIFNVCNILFKMEIPKVLVSDYKIPNIVSYALINDIFDSGTFGGKDKSQMFGRELAFDKEFEKGTSRFRIIGRFIKLLFPPIKDMNAKYDYAKENILLAPVAWVHHIFEGFKNDDYDFKTKFNIGIASIFVSNKRSKLLKELDI